MTPNKPPNDGPEGSSRYDRSPYRFEQRLMIAALARGAEFTERNSAVVGIVYALIAATLTSVKALYCRDWRLGVVAGSLLPAYWLCFQLSKWLTRSKERRIRMLPASVRKEYERLVIVSIRKALVRAAPAITLGAALHHSGAGNLCAFLTLVLGAMGLSLPTFRRDALAARALLIAAEGDGPTRS